MGAGPWRRGGQGLRCAAGRGSRVLGLGQGWGCAQEPSLAAMRPSECHEVLGLGTAQGPPPLAAQPSTFLPRFPTFPAAQNQWVN